MNNFYTNKYNQNIFYIKYLWVLNNNKFIIK